MHNHPIKKGVPVKKLVHLQSKIIRTAVDRINTGTDTMKTKKTYQQLKAEAREKAIDWQSTWYDTNYSYGELAAWQEFFERLGRRFGLLQEFRENAII